jgi:hypothetical protein
LSAGAVNETVAIVGSLDVAPLIPGLSGMVIPVAGVIIIPPTILIPGPIDKDM